MRDLLGEGIFFFNAGRYFEAHEVLEDLWRSTQGRLRLFYQGLIQAAVGLHHLEKGNLAGARAQLVKSIAKLEQYPPSFCKLDNAGLIRGLKQVLEGPVTQPITIQRL